MPADRFITTDNGGHPVVLDDIRRFLGQEAASESIYQFFDEFLSDHSANLKVQGCVITGSNPTKSMTEGWILLAGELMKVEARTSDIDDTTDNTFTKQTSFDSAGDKTFLNGASVQTYQKIRGIVNGTGGTLPIAQAPWAEFTGYLFRDTGGTETLKNLRTKIIEIGDWDMDANANISVTHGIADHQGIRSAEVMIRNDAATLVTNLDAFTAANGAEGGISAINSGTVTLQRLAGGTFDATIYDSTTFNRGWVTIQYEI